MALLDFKSEKNLYIYIYIYIFDLQVTQVLPTKFRVNWPFSSGEQCKIDFKDSNHGGHLGFPIKTILAVLDLQVTMMLPTKFPVSWLFGSEEEAKNRFLRWWPSWLCDLNYVSYF